MLVIILETAIHPWEHWPKCWCSSSILLYITHLGTHQPGGTGIRYHQTLLYYQVVGNKEHSCKFCSSVDKLPSGSQHSQYSQMTLPLMTPRSVLVEVRMRKNWKPQWMWPVFLFKGITHFKIYLAQTRTLIITNNFHISKLNLYWESFFLYIHTFSNTQYKQTWILSIFCHCLLHGFKKFNSYDQNIKFQLIL